MYSTTKKFTRTRLQLIMAALFAPKCTLLDTRYDKYVETEIQKEKVIEERIVIGTPCALDVFRSTAHDPAFTDKRSSMYVYSLSPEAALAAGQAYANEQKITNSISAFRALLIGGEYFLMSQVNPQPIKVNPS